MNKLEGFNKIHCSPQETGILRIRAQNLAESEKT